MNQGCSIIQTPCCRPSGMHRKKLSLITGSCMSACQGSLHSLVPFSYDLMFLGNTFSSRNFHAGLGLFLDHTEKFKNIFSSLTSFFVCVFGLYLVALRASSWLCNQGSLLAVLVDPMWQQGSNLGWLYAKQGKHATSLALNSLIS